MANRGDLLPATIEAIQAAALDASRWPVALASVTRLVGGVGATLEIVEKPSLRPREFHQFGLPTASELSYLDQYASLNPRLALASRQKVGHAIWDYLCLDE